ncbi:ROK family glucokinase [Mycoplasmatota bacterium WC44]
MKYIFGVDIGGTTIKIGLFNEELEVISKTSIPTNVSDSGKYIASEITKKLETILEVNNVQNSEVIGVGLGIPGPVKNNFVEQCPNIKWNNLDVKEQFKKCLPNHYIIESGNDANVAALGELSVMGNEYSDIVLITLGTGVGGGVIIDGEIHEGNSGFGGEIGHIPLDEEYKFKCGCGNIGCIETVASANGLVRITNYHKDNDTRTILKDVTAKSIFEAAKDNDEFALEMVKRYTKKLVKLIATLSVVLDPCAYIIGGGVSQAGNILLEHIKNEYKENISFTKLKETKFYIAKLGNDAGIYGAAKLIKNKTR